MQVSEDKNYLISSSMHLLLLSGHAPCLQLLLNNECDVTAMDNYGDTPLRVAERHNHHECIKMIREHS